MSHLPTHSQNIVRSVIALALAVAMSGCDRNAAQLTTLKEENKRLRTEIANLRRKVSGEKESEPTTGKPDMILGMNELWSQRFEGNEIRAKQVLADKLLRVTGVLDAVSDRSISIYGLGKARNVRVIVNFEKGYASRIQEGLAVLEQGATITVQGRFAYNRMELNDATIVDKYTGALVTAEQLQTVGLGGTPLPENQ